MFYWVLKTVVLGPILRLLFRPWVEGAEHIPETGGAIFASNHLSFSDSIFLPLAVPRRMTFLAKSDYFTGEGIKGRLTAAFFKGVGQVPVDRSGGRASDAALNSGLKVLRRGNFFDVGELFYAFVLFFQLNRQLFGIAVFVEFVNHA